MHSTSTRQLRRVIAGTIALAILAAPAVADAQSKGKGKGRTTTSRGGQVATEDIPAGMMPKAGQCRVWVAGTPAGQQAAPTDCVTASQQALAMRNARVVVGRDKDARKGGTVSCSGSTVRLPSSAPSMHWGANLTNGQTVNQLPEWHLKDVIVGLTDRQEDGVPETISWRTQEGQVLQIWHDFDNDGTADMVQLFCDGAEVQQLWY